MNDSINSNVSSTNNSNGSTDSNGSTTPNAFRRLFQIDVSAHIEKKGPFSYLSWPFAVAQLRLADPSATWEVRRFAGLPYLETALGFFVEVAVTVQGVTLSQIHPVLDARNRPIPVPTTFDINTSIQRALVKAIALHGLGLSIYAGEDLPILEAADATSVRLVTLPGATGESASTSGSGVSGAASGVVNSPEPGNPASPTPPGSPNPPTHPSPVRAPSGSGTGSRPSSDFVTLAQVRYITKLIAETGTEVQKVLDYFGVERIEDIAKSEASRVIRSLEQQRDQRGSDRRAA